MKSNALLIALLVPTLFGVGCAQKNASVEPVESNRLQVIQEDVTSTSPVVAPQVYFYRGTDASGNPIQYAYTLDASGVKHEIVAGVMYRFSGMNHVPDTFTVMNSRTSDQDTPKSVGEQFSVSISDGKKDAGNSDVYLYDLTFSLSKPYQSLAKYQVNGPKTSTDGIVELLGKETLEHPRQVWLKIGDGTFVFDKTAKTIQRTDVVSPAGEAIK